MVNRALGKTSTIKVFIMDYYYSSNLRAHGVCDYGTLPVM